MIDNILNKKFKLNIMLKNITFVLNLIKLYLIKKFKIEHFVNIFSSYHRNSFKNIFFI